MPEWKQVIRQRLAGVKLESAREAAIFEELVQYHRTTQSPAALIQEVRLARQARIETLILTPSPRRAVWMLLRPEELENEKRELIDNLYHLSPEVETAQELAISFIGMIRKRRAERFDGWNRTS